MVSKRPRKVRNAQRRAPIHRASTALNAHLSLDLKMEYGIRSARMRVGDSVKILRGAYKGVEGKVMRVYRDEGRVAVEGLTRQNARGDNVPVKVHASNLMITRLNLDDKLRKEKLASHSHVEGG